jgi:hypothetical protein
MEARQNGTGGNVEVLYRLGPEKVFPWRGTNSQGKYREFDVTELNSDRERPCGSVYEQVIHL